MENLEKKTLGDRIEEIISTNKGVVALKQLYKNIKDKPEETVRAAIYKDRKDRFERVGKGLYVLKGENSASLIIEGNGRDMKEIEDNSMDCIITDHPWSDKKAHKSGNQKGFAEYDSFRYEQSDFDNKARVLKEGCFLAEFVPVESFSNYEYLFKIKDMAKKAGFSYYAKIMWRKAPEGTVNTGRTTKGVEDILIFYKGKRPRRLSSTKTKPYFTTEMLNYELNIPANKGKNKNHQAEKPLDVYEYLIEQLTAEGDVCLDQFGGSCNIVKAANNKGRFAIAYELCEDFVNNAVKRFNCVPLFKELITNDSSKQESEVPKSNVETYMENNIEEDKAEPEEASVRDIPQETTVFQMKTLRRLLERRESLFTEEQGLFMRDMSSKTPVEINELFQTVVNKGYEQYQAPAVEVDLISLQIVRDILKLDIFPKFSNKHKDTFTREFFKNKYLEAESYVKFLVINNLTESINTEEGLGKYKDYLISTEQYSEEKFRVLKGFILG